jgi:hypothetical protein
MKKINFLIIINIIIILSFITYIFFDEKETISNNILSLIVIFTPLIFMILKYNYLIKINSK